MTSKPMVLIINADYSPMLHVSVQKAFTMIWRGVAVPEVEHPELKFGIFPMPMTIRLVKFVPMNWFFAKPLAWSKRGVMLRDNRICAYCGGKANTIDHVHPQEKGGKSTWENTVAACFKCNNKKDNKSLEQMGWTLKTKPRVPHRTELVHNRIQLAEERFIS